MAVISGKGMSRKEKTIKQLFIGECWEYLRNNFYKFNEGNKIKIALELCKKDIPQIMEGEIKYTAMSVVRIETKPLMLDIGEVPEKIKERV